MVRVFRQGDCVLKETKLQNLGIHVTVGKETKVMGETGHPHLVQVSRVVETFEDGKQYAIAEQEGQIMHPEHDTVKLPSGVYSVSRVRNYNAPAEKLDSYSS